MSIKMIVTDLDRTLLKEDKTISEHSKRVFADCKSKGVKIVFATARPIRNTVEFLDYIEADAIIVHNGALALSGEKVLYDAGIQFEKAKSFINDLLKVFPQTMLAIEIDDMLYANFDFKKIGINTAGKVADFSNFSDIPANTANKIIIVESDSNKIKSFSKYLSDDLYIQVSEGSLGLIMNKNATKLNAIKAVAKHFNISINDTVTFVDDYNDIEMLRGCGIGVAMQNALEEAKLAADFVCSTNENDGVARWIEEQYLLRI